MTVQDSGTVDWLGIEKGTGAVLMTIIDDLDWSEEHEHLLLLQEKINTYLAFFESGEVYQAVEENIGRRVEPGTPMKVSILARYQWTPKALQFLGHVGGVMESIGLTLQFKVVEVDE